jgi:hypothetical protein
MRSGVLVSSLHQCAVDARYGTPDRQGYAMPGMGWTAGHKGLLGLVDTSQWVLGYRLQVAYSLRVALQGARFSLEPNCVKPKLHRHKQWRRVQVIKMRRVPCPLGQSKGSLGSLPAQPGG